MPAKKKARRGGEKAAAILTIHDADKMTRAGRLAIGRWLREKAADLEVHGDQLAGKFSARYLYR